MAKFSTLGYTDETIREMRQKANFCEFNPQTSDYTLVADDWGKWLKVTSGSDVDITVPVDIFPVGGALPVIRMGAGAVTVVPGEGVTINSDGEDNAIPSQYKTALLIQVSSNTWLLQGIGATGSSSGGGGSELTQLSTPTLTMTAASDTAIDFSWTNVSNESSYTVQIAEDSGFTTGVQTATPAADDTAHQFTGLDPETLYYGRVKAEGDGVTYSDSSYGTDSETTEASADPYAFEAPFTGSAGPLSGYTPDYGTIGTITGSPVLDGSGHLTMPSVSSFLTTSFDQSAFAARVDISSIADGASFYFLILTAGSANAYMSAIRSGSNVTVASFIDDGEADSEVIAVASFTGFLITRDLGNLNFYYLDGTGTPVMTYTTTDPGATYTNIKMNNLSGATTTLDNVRIVNL
jgi:hypothetical protein